MWKRIRSERGSAIAGLALALPMFLGLMLGVADLGRGYMTYIAMSNAAREGARWITLHPTDRAGGIDRATEEISSLGISSGAYRILVTPSKATYQQNEVVEVRIEYDYDIMFGAIPTLKDFTFVVKASMNVMYDPAELF
ncbi:MAG: TadE/TadG family type IV pilus assembly protein [Caldilineaceae bacterium]